MPEVFSLKIDCDIPDETLSFLGELVSPEKKIRAAKLFHKHDRINLLIGEILLRVAIQKRAGIAGAAVAFSKDEKGKPVLLSPAGLHFNISHSGDLIACALSDKPVGIDVQIIKPLANDIASRFFSADEREYLKKESGDPNAAFCRIWAMKESYIKWDGRGLSLPLSSFSVLELAGGGELYFHPAHLCGSAYCFVCTKSERIASHIHYKLSEFLQNPIIYMI